MKSVFIFISLLHLQSWAGTWEQSAEKLSGDPVVREQGIKELKEIKNLSEQLRNDFSRKKNLVLNVIRLLKMEEFYPRLKEIITTAEGSDLNWQIVRTATSIAKPSDQKLLAELYNKKLETKNLSTPTTLALLNGLQEFNFAIDEKKLMDYLNHSSYELRILATQIAAQLAQKDSSYDKVLQKAVTISPYQVRLEAYQGYLANQNLISGNKKALQKSCAEEKNDEVKQLCENMDGLKK